MLWFTNPSLGPVTLSCSTVTQDCHSWELSLQLFRFRAMEGMGLRTQTPFVTRHTHGVTPLRVQVLTENLKMTLNPSIGRKCIAVKNSCSDSLGGKHRRAVRLRCWFWGIPEFCPQGSSESGPQNYWCIWFYGDCTSSVLSLAGGLSLLRPVTAAPDFL